MSDVGELDAATVAIANALFRRMTGRGRWKLILEGEDGRLRVWSRSQGPHGVPALDEFDGEPGSDPTTSTGTATIRPASPTARKRPPGAINSPREGA